MTDLITHIKTLNAASREWAAAKEGRWVTTLVEEADHWAECGVYTVAQFDRYMNEQEIWDMYKEVNGVRPRGIDFKSMSDDEVVDMMLDLREQAEVHFRHEQEREAAAVEEFEAMIRQTIDMGAGDRETAIRWLKEAREGQEASDDFMEYEFGLPYGYLRNAA